MNEEKLIKDVFGYYAILTEPLRGYEYCTELLTDYEMPFVQLRIKKGAPKEITEIGLKMRRITEGSKTKFIMNDFPEIAKNIEADGLHIGQDDISYEKARELMGANSIIGLSTHNPTQTENACKLAPNYIGIGPVFPTPTKENPDPVIGIDGMRRMLDKATVSAVAIGGIDFTNIRQVLDGGAKNFCMVRQFTQSDKPEKILKDIIKICEEYSLMESR